MTYTREQHYIKKVVDKHGIQTFEVVVVVLLLLLLSFDVFVPTSAHPLLFSDKWFVQNILKCHFIPQVYFQDLLQGHEVIDSMIK